MGQVNQIKKKNNLKQMKRGRLGTPKIQTYHEPNEVTTNPNLNSSATCLDRTRCHP